jgi:ubiquitin-activating enzyme E1
LSFLKFSSLPTTLDLVDFQLFSCEFDKDTDAHMHVVSSCANLRARNYKIPEADMHKARGIAGKIIPAIATTTAMVTGFFENILFITVLFMIKINLGLICVELYKLAQGKNSVDKFLNTFSNLAIPYFSSMEPAPPQMVSTLVKGEVWKWNQVNITSNITPRCPN